MRQSLTEKDSRHGQNLSPQQPALPSLVKAPPPASPGPSLSKGPQQTVLPPISKPCPGAAPPPALRSSQQCALPPIYKGHPQTVLPSISKHLQQSLQASSSDGKHAHNSTPTPTPTPAQETQAKANKDHLPKKKKNDDKKKVKDKTPGISPETVLRNSAQYLTEYEQDEIKRYHQVWYLGEKALAKITYCKDTKFHNGGYDNKKGFYKAIIRDHLDYRFEVLRVIGTGLSGQVLKCMDHKSKELVAVKVVCNTKSGHEMGEEEIKNLKILQKIDKHNTAHIVHMKEHFSFRNHICITFEFFEKDLYKALKETRKWGFTEEKIRQYAVDVLKCLKVLKKNNIIHGDLKPENILLYKKCKVKVAAVTDFAGSCSEKNNKPVVTVTLPYTSPEMLLGLRCTSAIDMWSLGCTLAELCSGRPLFCSPNIVEQLNCIMKVRGVPPPKLLEKAPKKDHYFDETGSPKKLKEINQQSTTLAKKLKGASAEFLDFVERCLEYNPKARLTPKQAMEHPWIQNRKELANDDSHKSKV